MTKWILFLCEAFIFMMMIFMTSLDGKPKRNRLFSVTIPPEALNHQELKSIRRQYSNRLKLYAFFIILLELISLLFVFQFIALELLYFFMVLLAIFILPAFNYGQSNIALRALKQEKNWIAGNYSHGIHEDDFWIYGQFYNNPHDSSKWVSKQTGIGTTMNIAHKRQRHLMVTTWILICTLIIGLTAGLFYMEASVPAYEIDNQYLYVHYPIYYYKVPLDEIKSLTVIQELPYMSKTNGIETQDFARGYFYIQGHGRTFLSIYKEAPYILIDSLQGKLLINENSASGTYRLLEALDLVTLE